MRRRLSVAIGLLLGVLLSLSAVAPARAEQKVEKKTPARETRIDGTIHMTDKDTKTITVRLRGKTQQQQVVYTESTKFTFRNKPGSFNDVQDGRRVICLGKVNDKNQLVATRIDVRDTM